MPRFALLEHDWPLPHLDLMLEQDGTLLTWRLPIEFDPNTPTVAEPLPPHRLIYLDYEGPVSGGRGSVRRRDGGALEWLDVSPARLLVRLSGSLLNGVFHLSHEPSKTTTSAVFGRGDRVVNTGTE